MFEYSQGLGNFSNDLLVCAQQASFDEFYNQLYNRSQLFRGKKLPSIRFDKTPRYIASIDHVVARAPCVPVLAMIKDPGAIAWSDFKRSGMKMADICNWYDEWIEPKKDI